MSSEECGCNPDLNNIETSSNSQSNVSKRENDPKMKTARFFSKRCKINALCQLKQEDYRKSDDVIRDAVSKWQLHNKTKCLHENSVNAVLSSIYPSSYSNHASAINYRPNNVILENEAVLTAIERKGLKQNISNYRCYNELEDLKNECKKEDNQEQKETSINTPGYSMYPNFQGSFTFKNHNVDIPVTNNEVQDINFESTFMTKAVSAAIEVKGLCLGMDNV